MNLLFYTPVSLYYGSGFEEWLKKVSGVLNNKARISIACSSIGKETARWNEKTVKENYQYAEDVYFLQCFNIFSIIHPLTPLSIFRLYNLIKEIDVVYFNCAFFLHDIVLILITKLAGKKIIFGFHAPILFDNFFHNFYFKTVTFFLLKFVDAIHVNNASDKNLLLKVTKKTIFLIPNFLPKTEFPKKNCNNFNGQYVFAGRYDYQKGIDLIIKAILLVLLKNKKVKFIFFGKGSMIDLLKKLETNFPKNVFISGHELNKDKIYDGRKFVLLPSRQETFSMIPLEAMSRGIPVITTHTHGQIDVVSDKKDGFFMKEISAEALANTILEAEKIDKRTYHQISKNAREKIFKNYTEDSFVPKFLEMIYAV